MKVSRLSPIPEKLPSRYVRLTEKVSPEDAPPTKGSSPESSGFGAFLRAIFEPISAERKRLNRARYNSLPSRLQCPEQIMGRTHHSCGATYGILERCNFACTSCYLGSNANTTRALPWRQVKEQLDELRAYLGPKGKAQLTSGEVTLLPVEVLGRYIAYARSIDLDPMVMSHGERFLAEPNYLGTLVQAYGLQKVSIHVDVTQRGRRGWQPGCREPEFNGVRGKYASLIRDTRSLTGRPLKAAHTVTVTNENFSDIPEIMKWLLGNLDAFRMISFQPVAAVGRTEDEPCRDLGIPAVWEQICSGLGRELNRSAWIFGHPDCNSLVPVLVLQFGTQVHILETAREGARWDRAFLNRVHRAFGGFTTLGKPFLISALSLLSLGFRNLFLVTEAAGYALYRLWDLRRILLAAFWHLVRGKPLRLRPLVIVVHKFMSPDELATDSGRERLDACVFKVPVAGKMVSMCELNGTELRTSLNSGRTRKKSLAGEFLKE